jgi:hypothetical protein
LYNFLSEIFWQNVFCDLTTDTCQVDTPKNFKKKQKICNLTPLEVSYSKHFIAKHFLLKNYSGWYIFK